MLGGAEGGVEVPVVVVECRGSREAFDIVMSMCRLIMAVSVTVVMSISIAMIVLMKEGGADDIERETDTSYDEHKLWIVDMLKRDEAFYRLKRNTQT
jgi:hypothetical protein